MTEVGMKPGRPDRAQIVSIRSALRHDVNLLANSCLLVSCDDFCIGISPCVVSSMVATADARRDSSRGK
jgi:hypothetical protein